MSEPISYGGYALPMGGKILVGATHDRLDDGDPFELREADDARNLSGLAEVTGLTPKLAQHPSRASVRVTTADTLPRVLDLGDNRWAVTGLGSRGFVFAPLLAEALISHICAEPLPIARQVFSRFKAL